MLAKYMRGLRGEVRGRKGEKEGGKAMILGLTLNVSFPNQPGTRILNPTFLPSSPSNEIFICPSSGYSVSTIKTAGGFPSPKLSSTLDATKRWMATSRGVESVAWETE